MNGWLKTLAPTLILGFAVAVIAIADVGSATKKNEEQDKRIERVEATQRRIIRHTDYQSAVLHGIAEKLDVKTPPRPPDIE